MNSKKSIFTIVLLLVMLIVQVGCVAKADTEDENNSENEENLTDEESEKDEKNEFLPEVEVVKVEKFSPSYKETYIGKVEAYEEVQIVAESSGIVSDLYFDIGQPVEKGQTVAYIEKDERNALTVSYENAVSSLNNAIENLDMIAQTGQLSSEQAYIGLQQALDALESSYRGYDEQIELSEYDIENALLAIEGVEIQIDTLEDTIENTEIMNEGNVKLAKNSYETAKDSYEKAKEDLANAREDADDALEDYYADYLVSLEELNSLTLDNLEIIEDVLYGDYSQYLGSLDSKAGPDAGKSYISTLKIVENLENDILDLNKRDFEKIDEVSDYLMEAIDLFEETVEDTVYFLEKSEPGEGAGFSQSFLDGLILDVQALEPINEANKVMLEGLQDGVEDVRDYNDTQIDLLESSLNMAEDQYDAADIALENAEQAADISLNELDSQIDSLELQLETSENGYDMTRDLIESQLNTTEDQIKSLQLAYESAQKSYEIALANEVMQYNQGEDAVDAMQYQKDMAEISLEDLQIKTPINGIIIDNSIQEGSFVQQFSPVMTVANLDKLKITISLPREALSDLKLGQEVEIEDEFTATIYKVYPVADAATNKVKVEAVLDSDQLKDLIPGFVVDVAIDFETGSEAIYIPLAAVEIHRDNSTVFVYDDGEVTEREIETGEIVDDKIEVKSGLKISEEVVNNPFLIEDGDKVRKR